MVTNPRRGSLIRRSSISATIWLIRSFSRRALAGSITHSPSSLNKRCRADSNSMPGRAATNRSHACSTSTAWDAVDVTTATPISVRRCKSKYPVSATASPGNSRFTSAISGLTAERFCFSDLTSPSSTSRVSAPTYTALLHPLRIDTADPVLAAGGPAQQRASPAPGQPSNGPAQQRADSAPGGRAPPRPAAYSRTRLLPHLEGFNHVAELDVAVPDPDAALEALADLGRVILEPAQRLDAEAVLNHDTVPDQAGSAVSRDRARPDDTTGHVADLRYPENFPDFRGTELYLLELRLEHALERGLNLLDRLVDDRVVPDVHAFALGKLACPAGRPDVEADNHRVRGNRQVDVVLSDRANATADDPEYDVLTDVYLQQCVFQCLNRPGHVALDDEQQFLAGARLKCRFQVFKRDPRPALRELRGPFPGLTPLGDLPGHPVVGNGEEAVARIRHGGQAEHLDRAARRRFRYLITVLVQHRPNPAVSLATDDRVADLQRPALHEHRAHRAAPLVQVSLDRNALSRLMRIGPQVKLSVSGQHDRFEQFRDPGAVARRNIDEQRLTAELLGHQAVLGEL